ncbi:MAG: putative bifunctional diguanylate cyclase/phosphodiesterase [Terriglobales bacterium]
MTPPVNERILIVDDSEPNRDMLARRLQSRGYIPCQAESAEGLLERLQREPAAMVLLDLHMPRVSGLDALRQLRGRYSPTDLPVIMVTATGDSPTIVQALELGANDYVTKPIDFPVALARIRTHLAHRRAEAALHASEERYALAARGANDGLWDWNLQDGSIYFAPRWKSMLGYGAQEIGNRPQEWLDRVHPADRTRLESELEAHRSGRTPKFECEARVQHQDGSYRWMLSRGLAVYDPAGRALRMAGSQTDITPSKAADALTGLPNRLLFLDRLERLLARGRRPSGAPFAVLFLGLDGFKAVNASLGPARGDQLLLEVAGRLSQSLRDGDAASPRHTLFTLARLGGDEFAVLLDEDAHRGQALAVVRRLQQALAPPFHLHSNDVVISASVGIALSGSGSSSAEDLLRDAATAMAQAKALGKARCEVYRPNMRARVSERLTLEADLHLGLERQEFRNYYQPIVDLASGRVTGWEALLRWQHPTRGLLLPGEFVPVAEQTGAICELGWWNLAEACRQIRLWNASRADGVPLTIHVNLSVTQFGQSDLVPAIERELADAGLEPRILQLEVTESTIMAEPAVAVEKLRQLRSLGVGIAADDFGTGYSSLSYLDQLPLDALKLDRLFVNRLDSDPMQIARSVLPLAKSLGLAVIAEGVETAAQWAKLREMGCDYGQGFYFAKPLATADASSLLKEDTVPWRAFQACRRSTSPKKSSARTGTSVYAAAGNAAATARHCARRAGGRPPLVNA